MTNLVLIAKETIAGKVKTRLHPALTFEQAATLAAASITDTLRAVEDLPATRRILLFDGQVTPADAADFDVIHQVEGTLDVRLAALFNEVTGPTVLIGMDTPQLTAAMLAPAFEQWPSDVDAFFGPASDGGFWAIGLDAPAGDLILGVPMSRDDTGRIQLDRLVDAGLNVRMLEELTDVDTIDNAREVAALVPHSTFARTLAGFAASTSSTAPSRLVNA